MKIKDFCRTGEEREELAIDYIRLSMRAGLIFWILER
jgi:hypothetical protein